MAGIVDTSILAQLDAEGVLTEQDCPSLEVYLLIDSKKGWCDARGVIANEGSVLQDAHEHIVFQHEACHPYLVPQPRTYHYTTLHGPLGVFRDE